MNFLELVQALHRECGCAGSAPTAVTNQRGEALRLVGWIQSADKDIQKKHVDWKYLWAQYDQPVTEDEATVTRPTDLAVWDLVTFKIQEEGATEAFPIEAVEYHKVRTEPVDTQSGFPSRVVIMPNNSLRLDPPPDGAHRILADYWRKPTVMTANTSESSIPEDYHDVILGRAMLMYANYENAPEIEKQGNDKFAMFAQLENDQIPNENYSRFRQGGFFEVIAQ